MKVLFDLSSTQGQKTGIGYYTQHLIEGLLKENDIECVVGMLGGKICIGHELISLFDQQVFPTMPAQIKDKLKQFVRNKPGMYFLRKAIKDWAARANRTKLKSKGFIYHETNYIPREYSGRVVVTVHDLSHKRYPQFHPRERVDYLNYKLPTTLRMAQHIITDSVFTSYELMEYYKIPEDKISAIHLGVDTIFRPHQKKELLTLDRFRLRYQQYILSVCTLEPRKNIIRLIQAYKFLPKSLREEYPLVLVGAMGWQNETLMQLIEPLVQAKEVILLGYVERYDLAQLYSGAALFIYPSVYEGFGLPIIEAMASGVPVVTSNVSALVEISAGVTIDIDPFSLESITAGLEQGLTLGNEMRQDFISKGIARARELSWQSCITKTVEVYRSLE